MLKILLNTFRFLLFIAGIVAGFLTALVVLPLPGKTFFNRMSKLPPTAKDLIDNSIGLGVAVFRVGMSAGKEINLKCSEAYKFSKVKLEQINAQLKEVAKNNKKPGKRTNLENLTTKNSNGVTIQ